MNEYICSLLRPINNCGLQLWMSILDINNIVCNNILIYIAYNVAPNANSKTNIAVDLFDKTSHSALSNPPFGTFL